MRKRLRIMLSVLAMATLLTAGQPTARAQAQEAGIIIAGALLGLFIVFAASSGGGGAGDSEPVSPS